MSLKHSINCNITQQCKFDRKNYFYPDLPKAYQTSQLYLPICRNGWVEIDAADGGKKKVRIHQIHMEEDAGKLIHDSMNGGTLIDYNRCGVPLIEIVSEPDMTCAAEAVAYFNKLKSTFEYLGISDCKLQEGSMRADVNLSVKKVGSEELGTRTETKNLNSLRAMERAIEFEIYRQIDVLEEGGKIVQETRRWDDDKAIGYAMRSKENAHDYRYFPEPDLAPMNISDEWIAEIKARQPEMPDEKKDRYMNAFNLSEYDADLLIRSRHLAEIFEGATAVCNNAKDVANFINVDCMRLLNAEGGEPEDIKFSAENLGALIKLVDDGKINKTTAKQIFEIMFAENIDPVKYVKDNGLEMVSDDGALEKMVDEVIANNPKSVEDYKKGKKAAIGFLVGQIMKATKGQANAGKVNQMIQEKLNS